MVLIMLSENFHRAFSAVDLFAILIGTVALIGMVRWKWDIVPVVLSAGIAGLIFRMFLLGHSL
jgi:hypothetical protein